MDVLSSLAQHSAEVLTLLLVGFLALAVFVIVLALRQRRMSERWKDLLQGSRGDNLETLLYDHLRERLLLEEQVRSLKDRADRLEELQKSSKRFVGLVRYDAFEDVGGSQSFALAVYDDQGNGAVITSIVGRSDCRVYCKPLVNGRSERDLSQEEQRAIREARSDAPRTFVSP